MNKVLELYNNGEDPRSIAEKLNHSITLVYDCLDCGNRNGECKFNRDEWKQHYRACKCTEVSCYDFTKKKLRTYSSVTEAQQDVGHNLQACLRGSVDRINKLLWRYGHEDTIEYTDKEKLYIETGKINKGHTTAPQAMKAVIKCDQDWNELETYESIKGAVMANNGGMCEGPEKIRDCCNGKKKDYLGFKWKWAKPQVEHKYGKFNSRAINRLDSTTNEVLETYKSISDASRIFNVTTAAISKGLRGLQEKVCGFKWEYCDD